MEGWGLECKLGNIGKLGKLCKPRKLCTVNKNNYLATTVHGTECTECTQCTKFRANVRW